MRSAHLLLTLAVAATAACASTSPTPAPARAGVAAAASRAPAATLAARIDEALAALQRARGVQPAPLVDDATWLRRVTLDLAGRIPTETEARAFLADAGADKRPRAAEALLGSRDHAAHLARIWDDTLMGPRVKERQVDRAAFQRWLEARFAAKTPWDRLVTEIVTASGKNSAGGPAGPLALVSTGGADPDDVNGAVNWVVRYGRQPADLAGATAKGFLGVQIQCAQCHDHKTEKWTQGDFRSFAAAFAHVRVDRIERDKGRVPVVSLADGQRPMRRWYGDPELAKIADATPKALDGTDLSNGDNRRAALAAWMTSRDNPWFSRAFVNRVWAQLTGEGFVEPIDDLRPSNAPRGGGVLDLVAEAFEASGFDVDALYRAIVATQTYQRAVTTGAAGVAEGAWSRRALAPLSPDQLFDSIVTAAGLEPIVERVAGERADLVRARARMQMEFVFDDDSEANAESYRGTVQQALALMNGLVATAGTTLLEGSALDEVLREHATTPDRLTALFLRALGRPPTASELARFGAFVEGARDDDAKSAVTAPRAAPSPRGAGRRGRAGGAVLPGRIRSRARTAEERAYEDVLWTLLNTSEFTFQH